MSDLIKMIYKVPGQPSHKRLVTPEKMADLFVELSAVGATILVDVSRETEKITEPVVEIETVDTFGRRR